MAAMVAMALPTPIQMDLVLATDRAIALKFTLRFAIARGIVSIRVQFL